MKVYTVNKKIKDFLARKSHTFSQEWKTYKKKRWILCYGGAIIPFIVAIVYYVYDVCILHTSLDLAPLRAMAVGLVVGIVTWSVAIINYKVMLFNCGYVDNDGYDAELIVDDEKVVFIDTPNTDSTRDRRIIYYADIQEIYYQEKAYTFYVRCDYHLEYYRGMIRLGSDCQKNSWTFIPMYFNDCEEAVDFIMNHVSCKGERR